MAQFPLLDRTFAKFGVEVEHDADGFSRARVAHGLKVRPQCSYARHYMDEHPETSALKASA